MVRWVEPCFLHHHQRQLHPNQPNKIVLFGLEAHPIHPRTSCFSEKNRYLTISKSSDHKISHQISRNSENISLKNIPWNIVIITVKSPKYTWELAQKLSCLEHAIPAQFLTSSCRRKVSIEGLAERTKELPSWRERHGWSKWPAKWLDWGLSMSWRLNFIWPMFFASNRSLSDTVRLLKERKSHGLNLCQVLCSQTKACKAQVPFKAWGSGCLLERWWVFLSEWHQKWHQKWKKSGNLPGLVYTQNQLSHPQTTNSMRICLPTHGEIA